MNERTDDLCGVELAQAIEQLICLAKAGNAPAIIALLDETIPGAAIRSTPPPDFNMIE